MNNAELSKKVAAVLTTVKACDYPVYLRSITRLGTGTAIGIASSSDVVDTEVLPRPAMTFLSFEEVQGSAGLFQIGDRKFIFSTSLTSSDLSTKHIVYNNQVFRVLKFEPVMFDGGSVCFVAYARAM